jgi:CheY-like chemotaxis protein
MLTDTDAVCPSCRQRFAEDEPRYRRPDGDVHVRCFQGPRVLVIDDDPLFRDLVAYHVRHERSCTVHTASTGHEALEAIRAHVYDLILCDLRMPELDGPAFYRQIQAERPELVSRIVFLTAHAASKEFATFIRDAGVPLLRKPIPKEDLDETLARMMGPEARGVISGTLQTRRPDRITIDETLLLLRAGVTCDHAIGTTLRVVYLEHDGAKEARHIARVE